MIRQQNKRARVNSDSDLDDKDIKLMRRLVKTNYKILLLRSRYMLKNQMFKVLEMKMIKAIITVFTVTKNMKTMMGKVKIERMIRILKHQNSPYKSAKRKKFIPKSFESSGERSLPGYNQKKVKVFVLFVIGQ